jgi:hypothetical protein
MPSVAADDDGGRAGVVGRWRGWERRRRKVWRCANRPRNAFYWHAFFLAVTTSFTEVNTVMPALILEAGGTEVAVGVLTAIMLGLPLITQTCSRGSCTPRERKKPFLLLAINLRVLALAAAAVGIALYGTGTMIIRSCSPR